MFIPSSNWPLETHQRVCSLTPQQRWIRVLTLPSRVCSFRNRCGSRESQFALAFVSIENSHVEGTCLDRHYRSKNKRKSKKKTMPTRVPSLPLPATKSVLSAESEPIPIVLVLVLILILLRCHSTAIVSGINSEPVTIRCMMFYISRTSIFPVKLASCGQSSLLTLIEQLSNLS